MKHITVFRIFVFFNFLPPLFPPLLPPLAAFENSGPIPSRTQFPPLLLFLQIPGSSAASVSRNSWYFSSYSSYANTTVKKASSDYNVLIDLESLRLSQNLYYGFSDSLTLGVELPLILFWRGAMDTAITSFHSAIGLPPKNDRDEKDNTYSYTIENSDFSIKHRGENAPGIGDISLFAARRITPAGYPVEVKIIAALKLPTGARKNLHGSGKTDFGAGTYLGYKLNRATFHSLSSFIIPGRPKDFTGIKVTPFFTESFTVDYKIGGAVSFIAQLDFNSNPFPKKIQNLGNSTLELVTGIRNKIGKKSLLTVSLTEDITNGTTPDFSINLGFSAWL